MVKSLLWFCRLFSDQSNVPRLSTHCVAGVCVEAMLYSSVLTLVTTGLKKLVLVLYEAVVIVLDQKSQLPYRVAI